MIRSECLEQLATAIAAVRLDHPTRVAIDGIDGVGKTTLADELVGPLARTDRQVVRASVDAFHRPRADRYRRGTDSPEGYFLDSFDYASLRTALLHPLGPGGDRRFRPALFDHRTDRPVDGLVQFAAHDAILLFDGVFLQRPELADLWDFRVWVEAPFDVTVPRAISRDAGGPDQEVGIRAKYERRYAPGQRIYLDQCRPKDAAHVVVYNADFANPVLRFQRAPREAGQRLKVLTVPGYTGSGPNHWQTIWETVDHRITRVEQDDWDRPEAESWSAAIEAAVRSVAEPVVLVAHSCGTTAVAHWAARFPSQVAGAFLVAPPDSTRHDLAAPVREFALPSLTVLPFPSLVVASKNDPYCEFARAKEIARSWGAELVSAGSAGHINTASGHGPWPEGREMLKAFCEKLRAGPSRGASHR